MCCSIFSRRDELNRYFLHSSDRSSSTRSAGTRLNNGTGLRFFGGWGHLLAFIVFFHSRCLSVASPLIEVVAGILDEDDILFHERENAKRRGHSALGNIAGPADTAAERQQKGSEERMEFLFRTGDKSRVHSRCFDDERAFRILFLARPLVMNSVCMFALVFFLFSFFFPPSFFLAFDPSLSKIRVRTVF